MLNKLLYELGFKPKEISLYLAILEQGKITPARAAKVAGINRTTAYIIAKELVEKGLITEDLAGKQKYLVALPPDELKDISRKEEQDLQKKKNLIDKAVDELKSMTKNTRYSIPKITFVYEEDMEAFYYKQSPIWADSIMKKDTIWWGFQDPSFSKHYAIWIEWFWKNCAHKKLSVRLLTNESKYENIIRSKQYERRLIKFWDREGDFTGSTWVAGDYLIFAVTNQKPHYFVQIYDETLAHNMRELFKGIWEGL
jgi:predicted transcriptional regulator